MAAAESGLRFLIQSPAPLASAWSTWLPVVLRCVCGIALQRCTTVGSRLGAADSQHAVAGPNLRWVKSTHGSEVHRLAADAREEVGYESRMGLAPNEAESTGATLNVGPSSALGREIVKLRGRLS